MLVPNQLRGLMRPISICLRLVVRIDRTSIDLTPSEPQQVPLAVVREWKRLTHTAASSAPPTQSNVVGAVDLPW
jgi:hypothetical protein